MRKVAFRAVKLLFLRADKSTLCLLLQPNNYELLLFCLSRTPHPSQSTTSSETEPSPTTKSTKKLPKQPTYLPSPTQQCSKNTSKTYASGS